MDMENERLKFTPMAKGKLLEILGSLSQEQLQAVLAVVRGLELERHEASGTPKLEACERAFVNGEATGCAMAQEALIDLADKGRRQKCGEKVEKG